MPPFHANLIKKDRLVQISLHSDFQGDHWPELQTYYSGKIQEGYLHWDLDLRELNFINSMMLGHLVSFNKALVGQGGQLRLVLKRDNPITQLIHYARINRIIRVWVT